MSDTQTIELGGGRALAHREYGDPEGLTIVNCHGGLLCGLDVAPFDGPARALGLRLVSPDRPGLGRSGPAPGRTTADWPDDVAALLDALEIEQCALFGWSMGGQYALACAARLAPRVTRTTVIASCLPLDAAEHFEQLNAMDRRLTRLAQHLPRVATDTFRALGERPDARRRHGRTRPCEVRCPRRRRRSRGSPIPASPPRPPSRSKAATA
jgi:pimeloyl-ACP methyl ester carboxylesterase